MDECRAWNIAAAAAVSMLAAPGAASAEDKPAPKDNPAAATAIEDGKTAPGEKATIFDDTIKPVAPKPNPQGTVFDDTVKPVAPKPNPQGTTYDDSIKPVAPKP